MTVDATDRISGLSANEVAARKARGEVNAAPPTPGRTYRQIIFGNVFSFINNVFYALCLLLVLLGRPFDAILPLAVVLANVAVSVFQEVRAKRKLDEIALLTRPTAKVIRDGSEQSVDPGEIVRGDLLMVGPGDQIVVDGEVGATGRRPGLLGELLRHRHRPLRGTTNRGGKLRQPGYRRCPRRT
jgi:cation-transporting ATPase E